MKRLNAKEKNNANSDSKNVLEDNNSNSNPISNIIIVEKEVRV